MGAKIIDFRDKQYQHDYKQMIKSFREYRFDSKEKIELMCLDMWVQEDREGLHQLSEVYKYFEDANGFVEYYINQLNDSDKCYEEKAEALNCLFGYYDKYIEVLEQGELLLFAEVVTEWAEKDKAEEQTH